MHSLLEHRLKHLYKPAAIKSNKVVDLQIHTATVQKTKEILAFDKIHQPVLPPTVYQDPRKTSLTGEIEMIVDSDDHIEIHESPIQLNGGNSTSDKNVIIHVSPLPPPYPGISKKEVEDPALSAESSMPKTSNENLSVEPTNGTVQKDTTKDKIEVAVKFEQTDSQSIIDIPTKKQIGDNCVEVKLETEIPIVIDNHVTISNYESTEPESCIDVPQRSTAKKKRTISISSDDNIPPTKRLCAELKNSYGAHDKLLRDYIDNTSNNNLDELQRHLEQLAVDIQNLNELSQAKEQEWNNILHLKKIKEEIVLRLNRRKTVMEIMTTKVGEIATDYKLIDHTLPKRLMIPKDMQQPSMLNNNNNNSISNNSTINSVTMVPLVSSTPGNITAATSGMNTAQSILQSRANMRSSELAKEKANTSRLHRYVFIDLFLKM